jgi:hypothetical protein
MLSEKARTLDTLTMRNIREREREKIIMFEFRPPPPEQGLGDWEQERVRREQKLGEGLSEWELSENSALSEQEISRLKNTIPVFYIVASIAVVVFLIVVILGYNVFHFW